MILSMLNYNLNENSPSFLGGCEGLFIQTSIGGYFKFAGKRATAMI